MFVTDDIRYIGVNDHVIDLFEGQYEVPLGMAYNSYVILDEKIAVFDTVDANFTGEWMDNLAAALAGRKPDYLIVQHMEPDHSAGIVTFLNAYPEAKIAASAAAFNMFGQFYGMDVADRKVLLKDGATLELGKHVLTFLAAPMVHWPEVMMTYDRTDKVFFSADAFGKFGANDVVDPEGWACEARRYYFGIVGKYGQQVMKVLDKAAPLDIKTICPLHGPVLREDLDYYLTTYRTWSSYAPEDPGVTIAYTSVYGHTEAAAKKLGQLLEQYGCPKVSVTDLARDDMPEAVEDAFRYDRLVLATTTYNGEIFPIMRTFIEALTERNYQKRTVGIIENGTWAPAAEKTIKALFEGSRDISFAENTVHIRSALDETSSAALEALARELCASGSEAPAQPAPEGAAKKGFVCKICGYIYEGDTLPEDFVCPLCKHGAEDFEPLG